MRISFCLLLFAMVVWSCQDNQNSITNTTFNFEVETVEFEKKGGNCDAVGGACMTFSVSYPQLQAEDNDTIDKINEEIRNAIVKTFLYDNADASTLTIEQVAESSINDYETLLANNETYAQPWAMEATSKVVSQSVHHICVEIQEYNYLGGAHPNTYLQYLNFELPSGRLMEFSDLIIDEDLVIREAEAAFRKEVGIPAPESLQNEGYFAGKSFELPEEIGITEEGLIFYYNPYEIAAYALGPTKFVLPFENIQEAVSDKILN